MVISKEEARANIEKFLELYKQDLAEGIFKNQNEANTEKYIEELFVNLGWNRLRDLERQHNIGRDRTDYSVNLDGRPYFFVEVKKHREELIQAYKEQAIDYAWQAGIKWAVLTNLREIIVYNAQYRGSTEDILRLFKPITVTELLDRFEDLWLLSKYGAQNNLIEERAIATSKEKLKEPIKILSDSLLRWRSMLTSEMRAHPRLNQISGKEKQEADTWVDEAVQILLNRFIFLKTIEDLGQWNFSLKSVVANWKINRKNPLMTEISLFFRNVDSRYNAGLFAKHPCEDLILRDEILEKFIDELYFDRINNVEWNFRALISDNDILGLAYEQYLGTTLTEKQARIRFDKEKRKDLGIFYTPKPIVEFIVKNSLQQKLAGCKTLDNILNIKVLDPACGSGSFLKEVYRTFKEELKARKLDSQKYLDRDTKQMISVYDAVLKNCIYGVDLDKQACEMTKLNLLIMAAEGGTHRLPDVDNTIKQGNSIRTELFNWETKFPEIMSNGGFDIILGNPPYDVIYSGEKLEEYNYYKNNYISAEYNPNLFAIFIEKGMNLLKPKGILSFINPDTLLTNKYFGNLRRKIMKEFSIINITDLSSGVFPDAVVDTIIFIITKAHIKNNKITVVYNIENQEDLREQKFKIKEVLQNEFKESNNNEFNIYFNQSLATIKAKMMKDSIPLGKIVNIKRGMITKDNTKYVFDELTKKSVKDKTKLKKLLIGKDATRYRLNYSGHYILFDRSVAAYGGCWDKEIYESKEKLLIALITGGMEYRINATYDNQQYYALQNYNNLVITDSRFEIKYILGLINSRLLNDYYMLFFKDKNIKRNQLQQLPIKNIDKTNQQKFIDLVDKLIQAYVQKKDEVELLNRKLDELVYQVYEITVEDKKLIKTNL